MKRFFTSDFHFDDERLNLYGRDVLFKNAKELNSHIVKCWNEVVTDDDLVYVLGDVSFTLEGLDYIKRLNGDKILIKGNYDVNTKLGGTAKFNISDDILLDYFSEVYDDLFLDIGDEKVYLNHYPTNGISSNFNIVGHIHGTWKVSRNMINVGVDAWHFYPVSEDMIKFQMNGIRKYYDQNVFADELKANTDHIVHSFQVLKAPAYSKTDFDDVTIFLCGPIMGAPKWQDYVISEFSKLMKDKKLIKNITLASPLRYNYDGYYHLDQYDWETYHLDNAIENGIVFIWLPNEAQALNQPYPRSYARTTRFELGEICARHKGNIIAGYEAENFEGIEYIKYKFNIEFKHSLDEMIKDLYSKISKYIIE